MAPVTPSHSTPLANATPPRGAWRRAGAAIGWTAGVLLIVLALLWGIIQWGILPNLERWRIPIEQRASDVVGVRVNIGAIRVRSSGLMPTVELDDVVLHDHARREALRLSRVEATLSPQSVFSWTPHFERLSVDGARLDVRRDAQGRLHVAGIDISRAPAQGEDGRAARWLFEQNELAIRNASVQWTDEKRQAPPLALSAVDLVVRNVGRLHEVQLQATPPASWGQRFSAVGKFTHPLLPTLQAEQGWTRGSDYTTWSGTLVVDLPQADVVQLRQHVNLPFELTSGRGALKAWFDVSDGRWVGATADVALSDVDVRLASDLEPLDIASLQGRLGAKRLGDGAQQGTELSMQDLTFTTKAGQIWPRGDVRMTLRGSPRHPSGGELHAQRIDLAMLAVVATRLPLAADSRALLTQLQPQGHAERLDATWQGPLDALQSWRLAARVQGLALNANAVPIAAKIDDQTLGRPGIKNGNVDFVATQQGGEGSIAMADGALTFPGVLEQPRIEVQQLKADLRWTVAPGPTPDAPSAIVVSAQGLQFANADLQGTIDGTWRSGAGDGFGAGKRFPGALELSGKLTRGRVPATARYLPLGLGPDIRQYIARAFSAGRLTQATFKVRGDLWAFPFRRQNGEFRFIGLVDGVQMNIAPDAWAAPQRPAWPVFSNVAGEVIFDRTSMKIQNASGELEGVELSAVQGEVVDFANQPVLAIGGVARGPVGSMLRYVAQSPVGGWMGNALAQTTASGNTELAVRLNVPLKQLQSTTVQGSFALAGNDVRIGPDVPLLAKARGSVEFTEKKLTIKDAVATVHGGEARFEGGTQADGALLFTGQGVITAEGFAGASELGAVTRLGSVMKGQAPYQLSLKFFGPHPEFTVSSTLQGMAVNAPAPMGKAAESSMPLRVSTQLMAARGADKSTAPRDVLRIVVGPAAQAPIFTAHYERDTTGASPRVLAGGIGLGDAAPQPDTGVHAIVKADGLDVDAWQAFGVRLGFIGSTATAADASAALAPAGANHYAPSAIAVSANHVLFDARRLTRVTAGLTQRGADGTWRANLNADQLEGYVQWRPATLSQSPHVQARLSRLSLPAAVTDSVDAMLTDDAPTDPPSLDIVIDDFELKGRKLGRVEIDAVHEHTGGGAKAWRLNQLRVTMPEAQFKGRGRWSAPTGGGKARRMVLDFNLELLDSGALLSRFGLADVIRGGQGAMAGQISWTGSPLTWHAPSLAGNINLKMDAGQFLKVNAGAARLLGVLSLQSLPRRLMLDFRDVFSEGFAFDNITGDVVLAQGQASTNNLRMRGVQAAVLMEGRADIMRETQNLDVWVVPEINAGAASLVYAAINPAVGLGTFLAQLFLRRPLMEATTRHFHVKGSWADPQIDRVDRKPGDRMPDFDTEPTPLAQPSQGPDPAASPPRTNTP